jgi:hypothetical protein
MRREAPHLSFWFWVLTSYISHKKAAIWGGFLSTATSREAFH